MIKIMSDKEKPASDYDPCECGHYRHQHENGVGKCRMPDDTRPSLHPCVEFIFSRSQKADPKSPKSIVYCPICKRFHLSGCPLKNTYQNEG